MELVDSVCSVWYPAGHTPGLKGTMVVKWEGKQAVDTPRKTVVSVWVTVLPPTDPSYPRYVPDESTSSPSGERKYVGFIHADGGVNVVMSS